MRPLSKAATVILSGVVLTACGSSSSPSQTDRTTTPAQAQTQTQTQTQTTATAATTTTTTTPATTTVSGPQPCTAADLAVSYLGQLGATGHGELGFALRNRSSRPCHTYGYPGVLFLAKDGRPLPTDSMRTTHDFFGSAPKVRLLLAPGGRASFRLGVTHGAVPNEPCTTAYGLQVIAPDDTARMRVAINLGAYECRTATVSPLRPGTAAFP